MKLNASTCKQLGTCFVFFLKQIGSCLQKGTKSRPFLTLPLGVTAVCVFSLITYTNPIIAQYPVVIDESSGSLSSHSGALSLGSLNGSLKCLLVVGWEEFGLVAFVCNYYLSGCDILCVYLVYVIAVFKSVSFSLMFVVLGIDSFESYQFEVLMIL